MNNKSSKESKRDAKEEKKGEEEGGERTIVLDPSRAAYEMSDSAATKSPRERVVDETIEGEAKFQGGIVKKRKATVREDTK